MSTFKFILFSLLLAVGSLKLVSNENHQSESIPDELLKERLAFMREEEKMARDVYTFLYQKWGLNPFGNIRTSEQQHMDAMKTLLNIYGIPDPLTLTGDKPGKFINADLQKLYNELIERGSKSIEEALRVGVLIEEIDIQDLTDIIDSTDISYIRSVLEALRSASYNHLNAFERNLEMRGFAK